VILKTKRKKVLIICGWYTKGASYFHHIAPWGRHECTLNRPNGLPTKPEQLGDFFDQILGFEALKDFDIEKELSYLEPNTRAKTRLYNAAVWNADGTVEFHDFGKGSNSTHRGKRSGKYVQSYNVEAVDFVEILKNFPKDKFELYIVMNIEGAEFDVLDHMFESKVLDNITIRQLYLDYHDNLGTIENTKELGKKMSEHDTVLRKYFDLRNHRPYSDCPIDWIYVKFP